MYPIIVVFIHVALAYNKTTCVIIREKKARLSIFICVFFPEPEAFPFITDVNNTIQSVE